MFVQFQSHRPRFFIGCYCYNVQYISSETELQFVLSSETHNVFYLHIFSGIRIRIRDGQAITPYSFLWALMTSTTTSVAVSLHRHRS